MREGDFFEHTRLAQPHGFMVVRASELDELARRRWATDDGTSGLEYAAIELSADPVANLGWNGSLAVQIEWFTSGSPSEEHLRSSRGGTSSRRRCGAPQDGNRVSSAGRRASPTARISVRCRRPSANLSHSRRLWGWVFAGLSRATAPPAPTGSPASHQHRRSPAATAYRETFGFSSG